MLCEFDGLFLEASALKLGGGNCGLCHFHFICAASSFDLFKAFSVLKLQYFDRRFTVCFRL